MLQHGLTAAERSRNKASAAFRDGIQCVDGTHTRLHHFERTRFLDIAAHGHLDGPFLGHVHLHFLTFLVGQRGNGVGDFVLSSGSYRLHGISALETERHHDFVRQPAFFDFA